MPILSLTKEDYERLNLIPIKCMDCGADLGLDHASLATAPRCIDCGFKKFVAPVFRPCCEDRAPYGAPHKATCTGPEPEGDEPDGDEGEDSDTTIHDECDCDKCRDYEEGESDAWSGGFADNH